MRTEPLLVSTNPAEKLTARIAAFVSLLVWQPHAVSPITIGQVLQRLSISSYEILQLVARAKALAGDGGLLLLAVQSHLRRTRAHLLDSPK